MDYAERKEHPAENVMCEAECSAASVAARTTSSSYFQMINDAAASPLGLTSFG